jgi:hypothetical protein
MMNERIQELYDQAIILEGNGDYVAGELDPVKFAELIVEECIEKITTYDLVPGHSAKWEDIYDIHTRLIQDLGEELKEHFGVTK